MNFTRTLVYLLAQISTSLKSEIEKQLNEFDLHSGQIFVMFELWKKDGTSQIELSSNLLLSPPTINKMVKSLAKNDFVVSRVCSKDGRIMRVYLTDKGVAVRSGVEEKWAKIEEKLLLNLTATEQLVLSQLFDKLAENFSLPNKPISG